MDLATIAALVSNGWRAATAATRAQTIPTMPALEAHTFSHDAATTAAAITILVDIEQDFARLRRAVVRGQ